MFVFATTSAFHSSKQLRVIQQLHPDHHHHHHHERKANSQIRPQQGQQQHRQRIPMPPSNISTGSSGGDSGARTKARPNGRRRRKLLRDAVCVIFVSLACLNVVMVWKAKATGILDRRHVLDAVWGTSSMKYQKQGQRRGVRSRFGDRGEPNADQQLQQYAWNNDNDFLMGGSGQLRNSSISISNNTNGYLIFEPLPYGQGIGNIMAGLLSAHLLAYEFRRVVCVSPKWNSFHQAFEAIDPLAVTHCPTIARQNTIRHDNSVRLVNYETAPNECALQHVLGREGPNVLYFVGNTYPRWPPIPKHSGFSFLAFYRPKPALQALLPWRPHPQQQQQENGQASISQASSPPRIVVHLREADGSVDPRKGTDAASLKALGEMLPRSTTYLVTNRVEWYDSFEQQFGWQHPNWHEVIHSALGMSWGKRGQKFIEPMRTPKHQVGTGSDGTMIDGSTANRANQIRGEQEKNLRDLQMWADWYTILRAQTVYHTHSDFSISAIHWQDIRNTKTILGWNTKTQQLELEEESWRIDGETIPLSQRTQYLTDPNHQDSTWILRLCGKNDFPLGMTQLNYNHRPHYKYGKHRLSPSLSADSLLSSDRMDEMMRLRRDDAAAPAPVTTAAGDGGGIPPILHNTNTAYAAKDSFFQRLQHFQIMQA